MKKLFYAFVIAATALLGGCKEVTPEIVLPEDFDNTSLLMDYCEVNARGNNNYVIYFETLSAGETNRRVALDITAENAVEGVPVGTFSVADGSMAAGSLAPVLAGSYYLRLTEASVLSIIEEATLTIAQNEEGGFTFEAKITGNTNLLAEAEEEETAPERFVDVECKYVGTPALSGMKNGQFTEFDSYVCIVQYSETSVGDKTYAEWEFMNLSMNYYYYMATGQFYSNDLASFPIGAATYSIITAAEEGERGQERILPLGTFPIDFYGLNFNNVVLNAEIEYIDPTTGADLLAPAYDGNVTIKALGGGQYSVTTTAFNKYGAYKTSTELVSIVDNTQIELTIPAENGLYLDWQENIAGNHWVVTALDPTNKIMAELIVYGKNSTEEGLASGVYKITDNTNLESLGSEYEGVIVKGEVDANGYANGSLLYDFTGNPIALIQEGDVTITNNSGVYTIEFNFEDQDGIYYYGGGSAPVVAEFPSQYNLTQASALFVGAGGWFLELTDPAKSGIGLTLRLLVITDEDATFADGLPEGTFNFDTTAAPGTVLAGLMDDNGAYYSLLVSKDGKSLYALLMDGSVKIAADGSNYAIEVVCSDQTGNIHRGNYTGAVQCVDGSEPASAPKKAQSITNWSNFDKKAATLGAHLNISKEDVVKAHARKAGIK